jgi:hypothetical protein
VKTLNFLLAWRTLGRAVASIFHPGMCSCTIWAKHDIILFRVALGFLLLIAYPFVFFGRHELYANGAAQGNAFSGAIALYRAKDGGGGDFWQITLLTRELGYGIIRAIQEKGIRPVYGMVVICGTQHSKV